jgi:hypothetical protein
MGQKPADRDPRQGRLDRRAGITAFRSTVQLSGNRHWCKQCQLSMHLSASCPPSHPSIHPSIHPPHSSTQLDWTGLDCFWPYISPLPALFGSNHHSSSYIRPTAVKSSGIFTSDHHLSFQSLSNIVSFQYHFLRHFSSPPLLLSTITTAALASISYLLSMAGQGTQDDGGPPTGTRENSGEPRRVSRNA